VGAVKIATAVVGTIGGVGAILAYSPPQQNGAGSLPAPSNSQTPQASSTPVQTPTPSQTPTQSSTPTPSRTSQNVRPTKIGKPLPKRTIKPVKEPISGTFTGDTIQTNYGPVQVQIDIVAGIIVDARALQLPSNTANDRRLNEIAIPYLIQETIKASSADIQGVGGATFTSQGWYDSLVSALAQAGL
jgi:uncharacterized protein with FMN-binding domain